MAKRKKQKSRKSKAKRNKPKKKKSAAKKSSRSKTKLKKKKPARKKSKKISKARKVKQAKKKASKAKKKKAKKVLKKKKLSKKKLKAAAKKEKISKKEKKKEKPAVAPLEIVSAKTKETAEQLPKPPSPKVIARAKAALEAKEKAKIPPLPIDKAAAEKQLKLAEPKNKLVLEYIIHSSPALLFEFLTAPSGLSEWFADNVNISGSVYSFLWEGAEQKAKVLSAQENKSIRFQWMDRPANSYFELRIEKNELTDELSLLITDFAESPEETNSLEVLWQGQVQRLMKVIGSKI
ncbi:MAG: hypothetical protein HY063_04305 [Bacteroidetes bacterium]|nr:hypothetical protein [Bacteroidota bacterium]